METLEGFFQGEYSVAEHVLTPASSLRDDLWLDFLGLEDLGTYLSERMSDFKVESWDDVHTLGDVLALMPAQDGEVEKKQLPRVEPVDEATVKKWFPIVIDRQKSERQKSGAAVPLICFYHAGGMVGQMRLWSKELDAATGPYLAVNPLWCEMPGHGTRAKEPLSRNACEWSAEIARVVAGGLLGGDRSRPFGVLGYSVGTLHAFEVARELESLGFVPRVVAVFNRNAPQIPMDDANDNFGPKLSDDAFVAKMGTEYGQKTLLDMWQTARAMVLAALPVSRADMELLTAYRMAEGTEKLQAPLVVGGCTQDRPSNNEKAVRAWSERTRASADIRIFDGNHFLFTEQPKRIVPWLGERLQALMK